jgi:hypothetical protein
VHCYRNESGYMQCLGIASLDILFIVEKLEDKL